ncbi:MAG: HisA/HisF-related TIM barrel protein, partial [Nitrososphaeraceae archaeon]|nr:HisA/HisF-related TIM barrel protein [Nitrososphaeraceae archaeon]
MTNNNKRNRRVIVTMDLYDQKPVLVQNGKVTEIHSNGDIMQAFEKISIFPDILVVDLNGAIDGKRTNKHIIKNFATKYYIHSGGGLRTLEDIQDILESSARRIVVSSNTTEEFLNRIPKDRLIVELSVNELNHVLIHGRLTNTQIHINDELMRLSLLGVEVISITFHHTEGNLKGIPKSQIHEIMSYVPNAIQKVIIAGGISSLQDLEFIWTFPKAIPQLGSAIWKNKITPADIYANSINMKIVPAIIQDTQGRNKGLVYMNEESIRKTCDERILHRYSREHNRVMCKGSLSGNYQKVIKISMDCDSDSMLITVDSDKPFCHTGNYSCFSQQTVNKTSLSAINSHIKSKIGESSYSGTMQKWHGFSLSKVMEEFWEIVTATKETNSVKVHECSDLIV